MFPLGYGPESHDGDLLPFDKQWALIRFFFSWLACAFTPICIGIAQAFEFHYPVVQVGIVCDVFFCLEINEGISFHRLITKIHNILLRNKSPPTNQIEDEDDPLPVLWPFLRAALPLLLPLLAKSLGASDLWQAWLTVFRFVRLQDLLSTFHSLKYKFPDLQALRNNTINRCLLTAVFTSIYASTLASIWFYLSCRREDLCSSEEDDSWVGQDAVLRENSQFSIYIRSMHFIIQTLFTVGYGDINIVTNKEYVFSLFLILNGSLYYAFLISAITSLISNKDVAKKMFRSDLGNVRALLQVQDTPEGLRLRINQLLHFSLSRQCGCNENVFLNDIPVLLLKEMKHSYAAQLHQLPFFKSLSDSFIELCVERLTYRTYVPGSVVFFQNERGQREVLLLQTGKIELRVQSEKGNLFTYMPGDSLGDFHLIFGNLSEVTAQTSTFTEVMVLSISAFSDAIRVYNLGSEQSPDQWLAEQGEALRATVEAHKKDLEKFLKVRNKRMHDMMGEIKVVVPKLCVLPDSFFRPVWAAVSLVGIAYFTTAIPLRILSYYNCPPHHRHQCLSSWDHSLVVDYMWDVFFIVDIVIHSCFYSFRMSEQSDNILVTNWRQIARRFWRSPTAIISALAAFPLDLLAIRFGYLIYLRLLKLLWTSLVFDKFSTILYYHEHYSAKKQALLSTEGVTVLYLSIITFLVMLWTAVAWAMLHGSSIIGSLYWSMTTMTTVGFGDIVPETNNETLFAVIFCIVGPSCSATIVANAASFLNATNISVDNIGHRQVVVKSFLALLMPELENGRDRIPILAPFGGTDNLSDSDAGPFGHKNKVHPDGKSNSLPDDGPAPFLVSRQLSRQVSRQLSRQLSRQTSVLSMLNASFRGSPNTVISKSAIKYAQVMAYLHHVENEKRGLDEAKLMSTLLPDYMQHALQQARVMRFVVKSRFFSKCSSGFIRAVMLALELCFVPRHADIVCVGDDTPGSYMVKSGSVQIYTEKGRKYRKLTTGESFGEIHLMNRNPSLFKAVALEDCELLLFRRFRFQQLCREQGKRHMQEAMDHMKEVAQKASKTIAENKPQAFVRSLSVGFNDINDSTFVSPKSTHYTCWVILLMALALGNIVILPLRITFMEEHNYVLSFFMLFDYSCDLVYLADIILRSNYLVMHSDSDHPSREIIRKQYWQEGHCILHLLAVLPADLLVVIGGSDFVAPGVHMSIQQSIALYRMNKLLRCVDLGAYTTLIAEKLSRHFSDSLKLIIRVGNLIFAVIILAHIFGCLFYIVGNQQHLHGVEENWLDDLGILRNCSLGVAGHENRNLCESPPALKESIGNYVYSIYWATATLTTVGFGDISAVSSIEQTFAILVFLVGTAAYTVIVTNLEDIVSHLDVTSYIFKNRLLRVQNFLHREKVPDAFLRKNTLYHEKLWTMSKGAPGKEVQEFLPSNVYGGIVTTVLHDNISNLFFLRNRSTEFISDVAARMVLQTYVMSDTIFRSGEAANILYLLVSGEIAMMNDASGHRYEKIYVGEDCRLGNTEFFLRLTYECTAQASTDVLLFELSFKDFWGVVELHSQEDKFSQEKKEEEETLHKNSTLRIVEKFKTNMNKNSKMTLRMRTNSKQIYGDVNVCIKPNSWTSRGWTVASLFFITYILLTVPYYIAFRNSGIAVAIFDWILFVFLAADMYLRLRWFAVQEDGELITDYKHFSILYVARYLKIDIVSLLPIAPIVFMITGNSVLFAILRALYLCRTPRINRHFTDLLETLSTLTSNRISLSADKLRVVKIIMTVCYVAHVTSCSFCLIGIIQQIQGHDNWIDTNEYSHLPNLFIYLRAYFWAMYTIVTVGFGSIAIVTTAEKLFAMSIMIVGAIMCDAGVTAMLSSIIANADILSGVTRRSKEAMMQFCRSHEYSDDIQKRVALYYSYLSSHLEGSVELQDFRLMPVPLQIEFAELHTFDTLCSLCLLDTDNAETQLGFVYSLLRHVEPTIAIPGQVILGVGGLDVHILRQGKAYARLSGEKITPESSVKRRGSQSPGKRRDYYQVGEALCRQGQLTGKSPGKLVTVSLRSLEGLVVIPPPPPAGESAKHTRLLKQSSARALSSVFGLANSSVSLFQPSLVHARLSCGTRKLTTSSKNYSLVKDYEGGSKNAVAWKEQFTFHVPKSASNMKVLFFDDKKIEDDGYMGKVEICFDEMEETAEMKTIVRGGPGKEEKSKPKDVIGGQVGRRVGRVLNRLYSSIVGDDDEKGDKKSNEDTYKLNHKVPTTTTTTSPGTDLSSTLPSCTVSTSTSTQGKNKVNFAPETGELASFDDEDNALDSVPIPSPFDTSSSSSLPFSSTSTAAPSASASFEPDVFMYHMREDVKNKHGKLCGTANLQVTIKGATETDYTKGSKAKVFARNRQLSTTPTEAVAESFCHMFTLSWEKLTELRSFYDQLLHPPPPTSPPLSSRREKGQEVSFSERGGEEKEEPKSQHGHGHFHGDEDSAPSTAQTDATRAAKEHTSPRLQQQQQQQQQQKSQSQSPLVPGVEMHPPPCTETVQAKAKEDVKLSPLPKEKKKKKPCPSFSSVLHDNHELRKTVEGLSLTSKPEEDNKKKKEEEKEEGKEEEGGEEKKAAVKKVSNASTEDFTGTEEDSSSSRNNVVSTSKEVISGVGSESGDGSSVRSRTLSRRSSAPMDVKELGSEGLSSVRMFSEIESSRRRRVSDGEMEKVCGVSELAKDLRKGFIEEVIAEKSGIQMNWVHSEDE